MMQTSTIYDRLHREEREETKRVYLGALAFLQMLPKQFTTAEAARLDMISDSSKMVLPRNWPV